MGKEPIAMDTSRRAGGKGGFEFLGYMGALRDFEGFPLFLRVLGSTVDVFESFSGFSRGATFKKGTGFMVQIPRWRPPLTSLLWVVVTS